MRAPYLPVLLAAALSLTACGGEDETASARPAPAASPLAGGTAEPTSEAAPSPTVAPSPSAAASPSPAAAAPAGDVAFTPQGTRLSIGESAVVPQSDGGGSYGAVSLRVDEIVKGAPADLADLDLGDQVSGLTPYYVKITLTNVSGKDFAFSSLGFGNALLRDGSQAQRLALIGGDLPQCPSGPAPRTFSSKGASYQDCVVALASGTAEVTGYKHQHVLGTTTPGADYVEEPIVWGPSPVA